MWWLLACQTSEKPDFQEVETFRCEAPGPLSWSLDPEQEEFADFAAADRVDQGGIVLVDTEEGPILGYLGPQGQAAFRDLGGNRNLDDWETDAPGHAFSLADLDGDEQLELLLIGETTGIFWDFPGEHPDTSWLNGFHGVRDIAIADVNGDKNQDLLASYTLPNGQNPASTLLLGGGGRDLGAATTLPGTRWGNSFDTTFVDVNGDGKPDAHFCNDLGRDVAPNALYLNDAASLTPAADPLGLDLTADCMGSTWGDLNGDGQLDLLLGDAERFWLLTRDQTLGFVEQSATAHLPALDPKQMGWGVAIEDLDNDGLNDLLLPTSWFRDNTEVPWPVWLAFRQPDGSYLERSQEFGFPQAAHTRSVVATDLNGDGVIDPIFGDANRSPWIFYSDGCTEAGWLEVEAAPGTLVRVEAGSEAWVALVTTDGSFASARPPRVHIGLGAVPEVDRIVFTAPWSEEETLEGPIPARSLIRWRR